MDSSLISKCKIDTSARSPSGQLFTADSLVACVELSEYSLI